ncbi:MAG: carboxypeptidase-like regulatory domain-containing protein, partial [Bacteroidota bacterium]
MRSEAQSLEIKGVVTDAEDGQPIPGVTIIVKGTSRGAITDLDGKYTINVSSPNDTLVFSFVGKETQTVPVND